MKIGFVIDDSLDKPDGVQQYVRTVGNWLSEHGHDVRYLCGQTMSNDPAIFSLSRNVAVRFNQNRLTIPLPANKQAITNVLEHEKFDVLHVQMPYSPFLAGRIIAAAPADTAVIGTFHILPYGTLASIGTMMLGLISRKTLRRFNAVCAVSPAARDFAHETFRVEADIIPNAVDISSFKVEGVVIKNKIVFLGRLVERKGCADFLRALARVQPRLLESYDIVVAGKGPLEDELKQLAASLKLRVNFIGFVNEKDKPRLLASAQLAVFPSLSGESFGIVLIEAMAAGAGAVLGAANPGYASVLEQTQEALFVPGNYHQLAAIMTSLLSHPSQLRELHDVQQGMVRRYDASIVAGRLEEVYETAVAKVR